MTRTTALALFLVLGVTHSAEAQFYGIYTDAATYAPGDTVQVHGSAPSDADVVVRLLRVGSPEWTEITRSETVRVGPQPTRLGSFLEVEGLSGAGRDACTLEAIVRPTLIGGDDVVLVGERSASESGLALGVDVDGRVEARAGDAVVRGPVLAVDTWTHLALRFDGARLALFVDGEPAGDTAASAIPSVAAPFRIGARAEAPGDQTGVFDGRVDGVALWTRALTDEELRARNAAARAEPDPAPPTAEVDLWLGFEQDYPEVTDAAGHAVRVVNHGRPSVAGPFGEGRAFEVHRDQLVDAGWDAIASMPLPADAPSGLYTVQVLLGPDFEDDRSNASLFTGFVVRPSAPRAPIAVIVPVFTWMAYTDFPGSWSSDAPLEGATPRTRTPGGEAVSSVGNNSVYGVRGDGVTQPWFSGWRRPHPYKSFLSTDDNDYSVRSPQSRYLAEWLDTDGWDYDVYSDWDLTLGRVPTDGAYRVLLFHGHHEYWSDEMIGGANAHLDAGGSVLTTAGNLITWRATFDGDSVIEVRKFPGFEILGPADVRHAMDGGIAGGPFVTRRCEARDDYRFLGVVPHYVSTTCERPTDCFGRWEAENTSHWLWGGSGADDGDTFGRSPVDGIWTVGHEADSFFPDMAPPGLMPGTQVEVLATGARWGDADRIRFIDFSFDPTCEELRENAGPDLVATYAPDSDERAGNIVYYRHVGGGHVFTVGSTAAPWALGADGHVTGLVQHALRCMVRGEECDAPASRWPEVVEDGCGCRAAGAPSSRGGLVPLLLLGLVLARRRR